MAPEASQMLELFVWLMPAVKTLVCLAPEKEKWRFCFVT